MARQSATYTGRVTLSDENSLDRTTSAITYYSHGFLVWNLPPGLPFLITLGSLGKWCKSTKEAS
jgi:hypothetical protein